MGCLVSFLTILYGLLATSELVRDLENRARQFSYELRFSFFQVKKTSPHVVLIKIDDASFPGELSKSPVDRAWLAELITNTSRFNPKAIGLNIILDRPTNAQKDSKLADAIKKTGNVILRESYRYPNLDLFRNAALDSGVLVWKKDSAGTLQEVCVHPLTCQGKKGFHQLLWQSLSASKEKVTVAENRNRRWVRINFEMLENESAKKRIIRAAELNEMAYDFLKDKVVVIGTDFEANTRSFKTPLAQSYDFRMTELDIIDQILQMLIFDNQIHSVGHIEQVLILFCVLTLLSFMGVTRRYLLMVGAGVFMALFWIVTGFVLFAFYNTDISIVLPTVLVFVFLTFSITVLLHLEKVVSLKQALELEKQTSALKQAKIDYLTKQLDTHSMFNEFSRIKGLIVVEPDRAKNYLVQFTNMLRYSLQFGSQEKPSLERQLEFIEFYIEQQKLVHKELKVETEVEGSIEGICVPWNTLFVFVENALKYAKPEPNTPPVTIRLKVEDRKVIFTVKNHFEGDHNVPSTKTGLKNLRERLAIFYEEGSYLLQGNRVDNTWVAELILPITQ